MAEIKGKNKGEWSEMYIFFKLMSDRKVYVADKDMNKLKDVYTMAYDEVCMQQ